MKKAFDLHRFGLLMKWETLTEKKDYIRCTIGPGNSPYVPLLHTNTQYEDARNQFLSPWRS